MKPTITYNQRLEIRFPGKPSASIRHGLKDRGFWWDGAAGCWHLAKPVSVRFVRNEPVVTDGFQYALDFCITTLGLTTAEADQLKKQRDAAADQAGIRGMEEALGIA